MLEGFFYSNYFSRHSRAQGLFYALMVLLAVAYISTASLRTQGVRIDAMSNSHLKYQSSLYAQSILEMAKLCLEVLGKEQCNNEEFIFDAEHKGGYNLFNIDNGYEIHIYIEAINLRTSQVQRTLARVYLPIEKK